MVEDIDLISGDGSYKIEETEMGWAFNLTFINSIHIKGKTKIYDDDNEEQNKYFYDDLSMRNISNKHLYSVFATNNNVSVNKFHCYSKHVGSLDVDYIINMDIENMDLKKGWQSLEFW